MFCSAEPAAHAQDEMCGRCLYACRYYLSGQDAYRLKLLLPLTEETRKRMEEQIAQDELMGLQLTDMQAA